MGSINRKWQHMGGALTSDMDRFAVDMPDDADLKVCDCKLKGSD